MVWSVVTNNKKKEDWGVRSTSYTQHKYFSAQVLGTGTQFCELSSLKRNLEEGGQSQQLIVGPRLIFNFCPLYSPIPFALSYHLSRSCTFPKSRISMSKDKYLYSLVNYCWSPFTALVSHPISKSSDWKGLFPHSCPSELSQKRLKSTKVHVSG